MEWSDRGRIGRAGGWRFAQVGNGATTFPLLERTVDAAAQVGRADVDVPARIGGVEQWNENPGAALEAGRTMIAETTTFRFAPSREICATLGTRVRIQRRTQNLSQAELAALAGVSLDGLRGLESAGESSLDILVRVARALGLMDGFVDLMWPEPRSVAGVAHLEVVAQRLDAMSHNAPAGSTASRRYSQG